jgi:hypothetical protein
VCLRPLCAGLAANLTTNSNHTTQGTGRPLSRAGVGRLRRLPLPARPALKRAHLIGRPGPLMRARSPTAHGHIYSRPPPDRSICFAGARLAKLEARSPAPAGRLTRRESNQDELAHKLAPSLSTRVGRPSGSRRFSPSPGRPPLRPPDLAACRLSGGAPFGRSEIELIRLSHCAIMFVVRELSSSAGHPRCVCVVCRRACLSRVCLCC